MVVWIMALSETLFGPSAWVAAMTSSLDGFSLKMSLSDSALFVSSGSLFVNWGLGGTLINNELFSGNPQIMSDC